MFVHSQLPHEATGLVVEPSARIPSASWKFAGRWSDEQAQRIEW
jgi:hypothetical protein